MKYGAIILAEKASNIDNPYLEIKKLIVSLHQNCVRDSVLIDECGRVPLQIMADQMQIPYTKTDPHLQDSTVYMVRRGFRELPGDCDRIFICSVGKTNTYEKTLRKMMDSRADIVRFSKNSMDEYPLLLSVRSLGWLRIYNGNRGIQNALDELVYIDGAEQVVFNYEEEHTAHTSSGYQLSHKAVINWI